MPRLIHQMIYCCSILSILLSSYSLVGQTTTEIPKYFKNQFKERSYQPNSNLYKNLNGSCDIDLALDEVWGAGIATNQKLSIFNQFWNTIDEEFACFQDINPNWDSLYNHYQPLVAAGVSTGRFAGIMSTLAVALRESHTQVNVLEIQNTILEPCTPIMQVGGWGNVGHFGAGLTPMLDGSLLVYDVIDDHPLGLERGDIVLGYDGISWKDLYPSLLDMALPIQGWWWGSSPSSFDHSFLMSAGQNWHLFDTINILKYETSEMLDLATAPLADLDAFLFGTEQLDIPGVPKPDILEQQLFSWGFVEGTNIAYLYGWGWFWEAEAEFLAAIEEIMFDHETDGLIIDFRMNYGGNMFLSDKALELLFNQPTASIDWVERCDPNDHLGLCAQQVPHIYVINGQASSFYDKPIALLTGPGAISSGDQVALRVSLHPNTRVFGRPTSAAFNAPTGFNFAANATWSADYAQLDAFLLNDPGNYLTHEEFPIDEEVWLEQNDVANGDDTVVEAAIDWILGPVHTQEAFLAPDVIRIAPNPFDQQVYLKSSDQEIIQIRCYNQQGRLIFNTNINPSQEYLLALPEQLPKGSYYLQITFLTGEQQQAQLLKL